MAKKAQLVEVISALKTSQMVESNKISLIIKYQREISEFDNIIANMTASRNANTIKKHFLSLSENGNFCMPKMWKLKQKLNLKCHKPPTAKLDKNGQTITSKQGLLTLYENEYKERLSEMPPHAGYEDLQILKNYLFNLRMIIGASKKTENWSS